MIDDRAREYVLRDGIVYVPFRNIEDGSPLRYNGDIQHEFRLVNDGDGHFHYELACNGPLRARSSAERIYPNIGRGNCVGTLLYDLSEQNLEKWKAILRKYFEEHAGEIQARYDEMKAEDEAALSKVWAFDK